jgi:hypothetical protein
MIGKSIIPSGILLPNYYYFVIVKLCNFLDICGENSHMFFVYNYSVPLAYISGGSIRSLTRSRSLRLNVITSDFFNINNYLI